MLGTFSTAIATTINQAVADFGTSGLNDATALVAIGNHPGKSIQVLRATLDLTHSGAVRLIDRLESERLVKRSQSDADARSVEIRLTRSGRRRADKVLSARANAIDAVLDKLTEKQRVTLVPILETALKHLTHAEGNPLRICRLCDEQVCRPLGCPVEIAADCKPRSGQEFGDNS